MKIWLCSLILAAASCLAAYSLYRSGIATVKCIAAALFIFRSSKSAANVTVSGCSGWARHTLRLDGGRTYEFHLDAQISAGEAHVYLLDKGHNRLLSLDPCLSSGSVSPGESRGYSLLWEFKRTSGKLSLIWHEK